MSLLRKEVRTVGPNDPKYPAPKGATAYLLIAAAVEQQHGLVHGKLHAKGEHCAIGSYFDVDEHRYLNEDIIDEVAMVNDSVPHYSNVARKRFVLRWLKWKLTQLGMPGYRTSAAPTP